jgi:hypothetical protein
LKAAWRSWYRTARKLNGGTAPAGIRVTEFQRRGVPHIHALTVNTCAMCGTERRQADSLWKQYGKARVTRHRPGAGAGGYLGKYLAKDSRVEIATFGRFSQFARPLPDEPWTAARLTAPAGKAGREGHPSNTGPE